MILNCKKKNEKKNAVFMKRRKTGYEKGTFYENPLKIVFKKTI
jgi:hypothetical protein